MDLYVEVPNNLPPEWNDSVKLTRAIKKEFAKEGIEAEIDWKPNPFATEKDRELVLAILAVGAATMMVARAIKTVLDNINPAKQTVVYEKHQEPALDGAGKSIKGPDGQAVMRVTTTPVVLPSAGSKDSTVLDVLKVFKFESTTDTSGYAAAKAAAKTVVAKKAAKKGSRQKTDNKAG